MSMRPLFFLLFLPGFSFAQEPDPNLLAAADRWFQQEAWQQAAEAYERLASGFPLSNAAPRLLLRASQARTFLGELLQARGLLEQANARPSLPREKSQILVWLAHLETVLGRQEKAWDYWNEALRFSLTADQSRYIALRRLFTLNALGRYREILLESDQLLADASLEAPDRSAVWILRLEALDRLQLYAEIQDQRLLAGDDWPEDVKRQLDWYAAEAAFQLRQGGTQERLWRLMDSRPDILASAAVRLFSLLDPNDVQTLSRLTLTLDERLTQRPELLLLLHAQAAQRARELGAAELALFHWKKAWDLRRLTSVPPAVPMALARALEPASPAEALAVATEADTGSDPLLMETHWDLEARHGSAQAGLELGRLILSRFPDHERYPVWTLRHTILLISAGATDQADVFYRRFAAGAPSELRTSWQRVRITLLDAQKKPAEALEERLTLAHRLGNNLELWLETVRSAVAVKRWDTAMLSLDRAAALLPQSPRRGVLGAELRFWSGLLSLQQGRLTEAQNHWSGLPDLELLPETLRPPAYFYRAWLDLNLPQPRWDRVQGALRTFLSRYPGSPLYPEALMLAGRAAFLRAEWTDAEKYYTEASEGPSRGKALFQLAEVYLKTNREEEAKYTLSGIIKENLDTAPEAAWSLTVMDSATTNDPEAYWALFRNFPRTEISRRALYRSGELAFEQEKWQSAAARFNSYFRTFPQGPNRATAAMFAARSHARLGQWTEAVLALGLLIDSGVQAPEIPDALFLKAQIQIQAQNFEAAMTTLLELQRRFPQESLRLRVNAAVETAKRQAEGKDAKEAELWAALTEAAPQAKPPLQLELARYILGQQPYREPEAEALLRDLEGNTTPAIAAERLVLLGILAQKQSQDQEAVGLYLAAVRTRGLPSATAAEALYRAWNLLRRLDPPQSEQVYLLLQRQFSGSEWFRLTESERSAP